MRDTLSACIHHAEPVLCLARAPFGRCFIPLERLLEIARFAVAFVEQFDSPASREIMAAFMERREPDPAKID